jgi:DNA-binding SARP family transcriptional activator
MVRIYLTGRLLIESPSCMVDEAGLGGRQCRLLFAYLVLERSRPAPIDELIDLLWPEEPPAQPHVSVRALVSRLRNSLDRVGTARDLLTTASGCLQLQLPGAAFWIDFETAATAVDAAEGMLRQGRPSEAFPLATTANAISSRDFLPGEPAPWAVGRRAELRGIRVRAMEAVIDIMCRVKQWAVAVKVATDLVGLEPLRETAYEWLMQAQVGAGNRAEALRTYRRCQSILAEELGVSPSRQLQSALERVLQTSR